MDRRLFLGSAAATLALPGRATTGVRTAARMGCLPPWDATPQPEAIARILAAHRRLNAGLRFTA